MNSKFFKRAISIFGLAFLGFLVLGCATPPPPTPTELAQTYIKDAAMRITWKDSSRFDTVYEACNKAIELDPNAARAYLIRGQVHLYWGNHPSTINDLISELDLAIADFNKALALDSSLQKEAQAGIAEAQANRYDPKEFITVPEPGDFHPANYTSADLFTAVATAEKLETIHVNSDYSTYTPSKQFVSDVVVVGQNGTDIMFRTADNAISQAMKVSVRTGLTAGQQVRVYYRAYRIKDWEVIAIKRL
jgi:tetratricopeptide (TPR) repeat protein